MAGRGGSGSLFPGETSGHEGDHGPGDQGFGVVSDSIGDEPSGETSPSRSAGQQPAPRDAAAVDPAPLPVRLLNQQGPQGGVPPYAADVVFRSTCGGQRC